jgi:hypothetical protein
MNSWYRLRVKQQRGFCEAFPQQDNHLATDYQAIINKKATSTEAAFLLIIAWRALPSYIGVGAVELVGEAVVIFVFGTVGGIE